MVVSETSGEKIGTGAAIRRYPTWVWNPIASAYGHSKNYNLNITMTVGMIFFLGFPIYLHFLVDEEMIKIDPNDNSRPYGLLNGLVTRWQNYRKEARRERTRMG